MMDPLQSSLVDLTVRGGAGCVLTAQSYVGRIFSSLGIVPQNAADDRLSMERLRSMAVAHGRLKSYVVAMASLESLADAAAEPTSQASTRFSG